MLHELPQGKLLVYQVDLTHLEPARFDEIYDLLSKTAFDVKPVPAKQVLKVYWNFVEPIVDFIGCPQESVRPWQ